MNSFWLLISVFRFNLVAVQILHTLTLVSL